MPLKLNIDPAVRTYVLFVHIDRTGKILFKLR